MYCSPKFLYSNTNLQAVSKYLFISNHTLINYSIWIVSTPTPHGWGVYPQAAAGYPFTASVLAVKGDPIADLQEDLAAEQKARATYEKLIDLCKDDPDVIDPLRFLREREVVHFQRFGEALRGIQDKLAQKKFYTATKSCMNSAAGCMKSEVLGQMDDDCNCNR